MGFTAIWISPVVLLVPLISYLAQTLCVAVPTAVHVTSTQPQLQKMALVSLIHVPVVPMLVHATLTHQRSSMMALAASRTV
jgi:hypothetical protein